MIEVMDITVDDGMVHVEFQNATPEKHREAMEKLRKANPADFPAHFRNAVHQQYIFYILRPADYPQWFGHLRTGAFVFDLGINSNEQT